jgi:hypothetical protein
MWVTGLWRTMMLANLFAVLNMSTCGANHVLLSPVIFYTETHPASCTISTGSFPGIKSGRGVTLTPTFPTSAVVMKE